MAADRRSARPKKDVDYREQLEDDEEEEGDDTTQLKRKKRGDDGAYVERRSTAKAGPKKARKPRKAPGAARARKEGEDDEEGQEGEDGEGADQGDVDDGESIYYQCVMKGNRESTVKELKGEVERVHKEEGQREVAYVLMDFVLEATGYGPRELRKYRDDYGLHDNDTKDHVLHSIIDNKGDVSKTPFFWLPTSRGRATNAVKSFRRNYVQFVVDLFKSLDRTMLLDEDEETGNSTLVEILSWINTASNFSQRWVRDVGTATALAIYEALRHHMLTCRDEFYTFSRQADQEKKDAKTKHASAALKRMLSSANTAKEECQTLKTIMKEHIREEVLVRRFRDSFENVRFTVIEALGRWCRSNQSELSSIEQQLGYLGKALHDKCDRVRAAAADGMREAYESDELWQGLMDKAAEVGRESSLIKFKARIVEMCHDESLIAKHAALRCVTAMASRTYDDEGQSINLVADEDVDEVLDQMWLPPKQRDKLVLCGDFVNSAIFSQSIMRDWDERDAKADENDIKSMLEFFSEFAGDRNLLMHYFTEAYWQRAPCLLNTPLMVDLVTKAQSDHSSQPLDEKYKSPMLFLLQAVTRHMIRDTKGSGLRGRSPDRYEKDKEDAKKALNDTVVVVFNAIPDLVNLFKSSYAIPPVICVLAFEVCQYAGDNRSQLSLAEPIKALSEIFTNQNDPMSLEMSVGALENLEEALAPHHKDVTRTLESLCQTAVKNCMRHLGKYLKMKESQSQPSQPAVGSDQEGRTLSEALHSLRRVHALMKHRPAGVTGELLAVLASAVTARIEANSNRGEGEEEEDPDQRDKSCKRIANGEGPGARIVLYALDIYFMLLLHAIDEYFTWLDDEDEQQQEEEEQEQQQQQQQQQGDAAAQENGNQDEEAAAAEGEGEGEGEGQGGKGRGKRRARGGRKAAAGEPKKKERRVGPDPDRVQELESLLCQYGPVLYGLCADLLRYDPHPVVRQCAFGTLVNFAAVMSADEIDGQFRLHSEDGVEVGRCPDVHWSAMLDYFNHLLLICRKKRPAFDCDEEQDRPHDNDGNHRENGDGDQQQQQRGEGAGEGGGGGQDKEHPLGKNDPVYMRMEQLLDYPSEPSRFDPPPIGPSVPFYKYAHDIMKKNTAEEPGLFDILGSTEEQRRKFFAYTAMLAAKQVAENMSTHIVCERLGQLILCQYCQKTELPRIADFGKITIERVKQHHRGELFKFLFKTLQFMHTARPELLSKVASELTKFLGVRLPADDIKAFRFDFIRLAMDYVLEDPEHNANFFEKISPFASRHYLNEEDAKLEARRINWQCHQHEVPFDGPIKDFCQKLFRRAKGKRKGAPAAAAAANGDGEARPKAKAKAKRASKRKSPAAGDDDDDADGNDDKGNGNGDGEDEVLEEEEEHEERPRAKAKGKAKGKKRTRPNDGDGEEQEDQQGGEGDDDEQAADNDQEDLAHRARAKGKKKPAAEAKGPRAKRHRKQDQDQAEGGGEEDQPAGDGGDEQLEEEEEE
ncbi:unnamed protein product [Vitrella brassicaformis CCMP3155]|uniref:SCD domain-containing protein n=2 Tax=Vitrella brassicaformis TaxID=1169539 RepID=A0A0G4EKY8_VITBC|nr:unnamed protein product [Vitrella brassicaformis CCMP3155]|eukprot:CEL97841.1 unnamed protein product [Vitrella brassicaformis CCMP3155]